MKTNDFTQFTILPIDALSLLDQISFLEQELAGYQAAYTSWNRWLQDSRNKLRGNYESVAGYVREKARQVAETEDKITELKGKLK